MTASVAIICGSALGGMVLHWYLYRRAQPVSPAVAALIARADKADSEIKELRDRTSSLSLKQGLRL
jgi:hypothetical protein